MDVIRAAVIGVGNMGTAHAARLQEGKIAGMALCALVDTDAKRRAEIAQRFAGVPVFENVDALLKNGCVDAAIVATPHPSHTSVAEKTLAAGLHTLVEKPVDVMLSRARHLCDTADKSGCVFAVMLNQRTNPLFQKAREIVQSGQLGRIKRSVWIITNWYRSQQYYDSGAWRATWAGEGGGVLLNQAPHNLDLWQWICGMPLSIAAQCDVARYHNIEVEDDATICARFDDGATGVFITSTGEYPGTNRLEIAGEKGKIVLENGVLKWWKLQENERDVRFSASANSPKIPFEYEEIVQESKGAAHAGILQNWANAILHGEALISPGRDGLNELTISNAAYLSQWTGGKTVELPMDEALFDEMLARRAEASVLREDGEKAQPSGQYSRRWETNW